MSNKNVRVKIRLLCDSSEITPLKNSNIYLYFFIKF